MALLATKLFFPAVRPNFIARPHLVEKLDSGLRGPFTLISAPAGSGKTSLMAEWRVGPGRETQVCSLLDLLSPLFTERDGDAIKGVGWRLKTLGRYYPDIVSDWLVEQSSRPHRELMLRKATIYLPSEFRQRVIRKMP